MQALGDMVAVCGNNGQIIHANETFKKATGFDNPVGLTLAMAGIGLLALNAALAFVAYRLLKSGWKIKN